MYKKLFNLISKETEIVHKENSPKVIHKKEDIDDIIEEYFDYIDEIYEGGITIYKDYNYDQIPKHRKRKTKTVTKSDHKHIYTKEVLIKENNRYHYEKHCEICGKPGEVRYFESKKPEGSIYYTMLTQEEILDKYKHKHLEIIERG